MGAMSEAVGTPPRRARRAGIRFAGDDRLAKLATAGDQAAFAAIYRRYQRELHRYCQAILGSREEAEDALQNTLISAMKSLPGETREITLRPWLFRVAHNESISLLRQRRLHSELDLEEAAPDSDTDRRAETRQRLRELISDLGGLPDRQRGALVMRELSDLSYAEIADSFEFSEGAARQAIYEARSALHEMAEGRNMECTAVRQQISDQDRRILRGRRIRAHLQTCAGCRDFERAIDTRRKEFAQIAPLSPVAAAAILDSVLGGSSAGGGIAGLGAGGGALAGGSVAAKSVAAVVAAATIGVGTADLTGIIDVGGDDSGQSQSAAPASEGGSSATHGSAAGNAGAQGHSPGAANDDGSPSGKNGPGNGNGKANGQGNGRGHGVNGGGPPETPPGQSQTPPGQAAGGPSSAAEQNPNGIPPGQALTPPGQAAAPPAGGPPEEAPAGGSNAEPTG